MGIVELLGDGVSATAAARDWALANPEYLVEVRTQNQGFCEVLEGDHGWGTIKKYPGDFDLIRNPPDKDKYDKFIHLNVSAASAISWRENTHITDGFCRSIGLPTPSKKWGSLAPFKPYPGTEKQYLSVLPFCGGVKKSDTGGSERSLSFPVWNQILDIVSRYIPVKVFGHSKSPWKLFNKYVSNKPGVTLVSEESMIETLKYVLSPRSIGVIAPDSGPLHCVSAGCQQFKLYNFPVLAFLTSVIPENVNHPYGVPAKDLVTITGFCGRLGMKDIQESLESFIGKVLVKKRN
jgi:hypothetical protein